MVRSLAAIDHVINTPLYQNSSTQLKVADYPLSNGAVEISLKNPLPIHKLSKKHFSDIWKTRVIAEKHLSKANSLCYLKLKSGTSPTWQIVPYSSLPSCLDYTLIRKVYSVWKQSVVLFRTVFPASRQSIKYINKQKIFWSSVNTNIEHKSSKKNGTGALTRGDVIQKQIVYPDYSPESNSEAFLLYNYAPIRTGEQMHFLLVPNPNKPAKNFLELDKSQYVEIMLLKKKIMLWVEKNFPEATVHFFDKTGEIAGQTQPLFHTHCVIIVKPSEETKGKISMFFRMIFPTKSLSDKELSDRVTKYKNSLGKFLAHQD